MGQRPIGFWLRLLDRMLEERLDATLSQQSLSRRQWQILNLVAHTKRQPAELTEAMRPFLQEDRDLAPILEAMFARGLLANDGASLSATTSGRALLDDLTPAVAQDRAAVMQDITPAQYLATTEVLELMARNLGWDPEETA
jgi:DNA-binding MarR family transcriptional regulator